MFRAVVLRIYQTVVCVCFAGVFGSVRQRLWMLHRIVVVVWWHPVCARMFGHGSFLWLR